MKFSIYIRLEVNNMDRGNPNRDYFLNLHRNIIKTDNGYCLQKVYEEDENGNIRQISESD